MARILILLAFFLSILLAAVGCQSNEGSDLTKEDKVKMDKLFREGIKNPPSGDKSQAGVPLNAPTDE